LFGDALHNAWFILRSGDSELWAVVLTSLRISLIATVIAALIGVPIGYAVASSSFPGRRIVITILNTLQALPTVVIGLLLYGLLSKSGPLGGAGLLYSPWAVTLGEAVLILPIMAAYTLAAVSGVDPRVRKTARSLGAGGWREGWLVAGESRFGIAASVIAGFGRAIGEVGIAMMLGGNIAGFTRTITTTIALEHNKGNFALGLALGLILFCIALIVNGILHLLQGEGRK
jgi:tungstate transport system permease protein